MPRIKTLRLQDLLRMAPVIVAIVAMVAVMVSLKILIGPPSTPPQIILSHATSYFTEPLLPDGYIDYATALNQLREKSVPDDDNAAMLLMQLKADHPSPFQEWQDALLLDVDRWYPDAEATGRGRDSLRFSLEERLLLAPWTADEFPNVAAFLLSHQAAFHDLELVTGKSRLFLPLKPSPTITESCRAFRDYSFLGHSGDLIHLLYAADFWSEATIYRAMLKAKTEPIDEALSDLRITLKTADLIQQQPDFSFFQRSIFLRQKVATAVARIATTATSPQELDRLAEFVRQLDDSPADSNACREAVLTRRCEELSRIMALNAGDERVQALILPSGTYRDISETARHELHFRLDVNPLLRQINLQFDRIEHVLTNPDLRWQRQQVMLEPSPKKDGESSEVAMNRMGAVIDAVVRHPGSRAAVDQFIDQHIHFGFTFFLWKMTPKVQMETHCLSRFANIAVALQQLKIRDGLYPASLSDASDYLPFQSEETFQDPFGDGDFVYLRKDEGREFELSSAGPDGSITLDDPTFPNQPRLESTDWTDNPFMKRAEFQTK